MRHYVYTLAYPSEMSGSVFYVGKGSTVRSKVHEQEAKGECDCKKCMVIRSIWNAGHKVVTSVVFESYDPDLAYDHERTLIQSYGPEILVNKMGYLASPKPFERRQSRLISTEMTDRYSLVKFRPHAGSPLETALKDRAEQQLDSGYSQIAKRDLGRYYILLGRALPTFSEDDALVIVNALNGTKTTPEMAHRLYVDVEELIEESEEMRRLSSADMLIQLRNLSRIECMAIVDAAERFWLGGYHKSAEDVRQRLQDVGLVAQN